MMNQSNYYVIPEIYGGYNVGDGFMGRVLYEGTRIIFYKLFASESDYKDLFEEDKD